MTFKSANPMPTPRPGYLFCSHCRQEKIIAHKVETPDVPLTPEELAEAIKLRAKAPRKQLEGYVFNYYPTINYSCKKRGFNYICVACSQTMAADSLKRRTDAKKAAKAQQAESAAPAAPTPAPVQETSSWDPPRRT